MSSLLDLIRNCDVEWRKLGEVCDIKRGVRITKSQLSPEGAFPVVSGGVDYMGFCNDSNRPANTITIAQYGSAGYVNFQAREFWANDVCYSLLPKDCILNKYLYYYLINNQDHIYSLVNTLAIPHKLAANDILNMNIQVPPLEIQEKIVSYLDKFYNILVSSNTSLEKEIKLRQKQYRYYLHKLLNFNN